MAKILFILNGKQELVDAVDVTPEATILWHERIHGLLPNQFHPLEVDAEDYDDPVFEQGKPVMVPEKDANGDVIMEPLLDEKGEQVVNKQGELLFKPKDSAVQVTVKKRRLVFSQSKANARVAAEALKAAKQAEKQAEKQEMASLRLELDAETITSARLRKYLKIWLKHKGE